MKIWHISDTHGTHSRLIIPTDVDMVIHSGDASNSRDSGINNNEMLNFIDWYSKLPIKKKIYVAGNHDVSIQRLMIPRGYMEGAGITYLENSWQKVLGLKIWGSPITPSFGVGWAWNMSRHKTHRVWDTIPDDTDVVVTHGPPKNRLDLTWNVQGNLEQCGDNSLSAAILRVSPKLHLFGHVHNCKDLKNSGILKPSNEGVLYSNASVVPDGKVGELVSNGNIISL